MTVGLKTARLRGSTPRRARPTAVVSLFALTVFVSAALVFLIQPMFAKFVLPLYGSTPAVWNTAMVFFQLALLAAYMYAHESTRRLGVRRQAVLHMGVLALALLVLPIAVPAGFTPPAQGSPVLGLLGLLAVTVGLPFFVVAASAPLLQRWLAGVDHPAAADPYFLYAASNLGAILGLLAYPLALEPSMRLAQQGWVWSAGYGLLAALLLGCAAVVWLKRPAPGPCGDRSPPSALGAEAGRPTVIRSLRWVFLAFVPSSLMLGTTTYLTTDIAPVPLLWAIPLALYLLSFSLVFSPGVSPARLRRWTAPALPPLALAVVILPLVEANHLLVMPVHLLAFFVAAMVCHGELARDRPPARWLTGFYLSVALGGALGGVFNAIVAPAVFDSLLEYPLAVVLACLCMPPRTSRLAAGRLARRLDVVLPMAVGATAVVLLLVVDGVGDVVSLGDDETLQLEEGVALSLAAGLALTFVRRPLRFGLAVAAIGVAALLPIGDHATDLHHARSFFGVSRVTIPPGGGTHVLTHGTTEHGAQGFRPRPLLTPLTLYQRAGPIGQLMGTLPPAMSQRAAVIGLGTGSMACYARRGDHWTFYEIDRAVERIARDPRLFTFLRDCPGRYDVVLGDGRLSLSRVAGRRYGLIVLDAFSSDAIPTHLLTREAVALYRSRLREGGVLALHISNRYLDLEPVAAGLAADRGMVCRAQSDLYSTWAALAARREDLGVPAIDPRWHDCRGGGATVWTDDFSNLLGRLAL